MHIHTHRHAHAREAATKSVSANPYSGHMWAKRTRHVCAPGTCQMSLVMSNARDTSNVLAQRTSHVRASGTCQMSLVMCVWGGRGARHERESRRAPERSNARETLADDKENDAVIGASVPKEPSTSRRVAGHRGTQITRTPTNTPGGGIRGGIGAFLQVILHYFLDHTCEINK
jgi:hypothetical protein